MNPLNTLPVDQGILLEWYQDLLTARMLDQHLSSISNATSFQGGELVPLICTEPLDPARDRYFPHGVSTATALSRGVSAPNLMAGYLDRAQWNPPPDEEHLVDQAIHAGAKDDGVTVVSLPDGPVLRTLTERGADKAIVVVVSSDSGADRHSDAVHVDGSDAIALVGAIREAVDHARKNRKLGVVVAMVAQVDGRRGPDGAEELGRWRQKDPLRNLRQLMIEERILSEDQEAKITRRAEEATMMASASLRRAATGTAITEQKAPAEVIGHRPFESPISKDVDHPEQQPESAPDQETDVVDEAAGDVSPEIETVEEFRSGDAIPMRGTSALPETVPDDSLEAAEPEPAGIRPGESEPVRTPEPEFEPTPEPEPEFEPAPEPMSEPAFDDATSLQAEPEAAREPSEEPEPIAITFDPAETTVPPRTPTTAERSGITMDDSISMAGVDHDDPELEPRREARDGPAGVFPSTVSRHPARSIEPGTAEPGPSQSEPGHIRPDQQESEPDHAGRFDAGEATVSVQNGDELTLVFVGMEPSGLSIPGAHILSVHRLEPVDLAPITESVKETSKPLIVTTPATRPIGDIISAHISENLEDWLDADLEHITVTDLMSERSRIVKAASDLAEY